MRDNVNETKSKPSRRKMESPFAANLKRVMEIRGVSQTAAAQVAGVAASVLNGWLAGQAPYDLLAVQRLCRALNCNFEWILTGEGSMEQRALPSMEDVFEERDAFDGIFRISATRLVKKEQK